LLSFVVAKIKLIRKVAFKSDYFIKMIYKTHNWIINTWLYNFLQQCFFKCKKISIKLLFIAFYFAVLTFCLNGCCEEKALLSSNLIKVQKDLTVSAANHTMDKDVIKDWWLTFKVATQATAEKDEKS